MIRSKLLFTLAVVGGMVLGVVSFKWVASSSAQKKEAILAARTLGDAKARVRIMEFTDFQCPSCAKASEVLHELLKKSGADIFLELRYFPLEMHRHARRAAIAAECAAQQGKFWPMQNVLFRSQASWSGSDQPDTHFLNLGRGLGLDDAALMKCMAQPSVDALVQEDVVQGKRMGVKATPTFFINGKMVVGVPAFEKALKELLP